MKPETAQNKTNVPKTKIGFYLAWIAILAGLLSVIHNHLSSIQIPKKDDYKG